MPPNERRKFLLIVRPLKNALNFKNFMDYTIKKQSVIFELPLYKFFGVQKKYRHEKWEENFINSIQDWEENCFENFESFSPYLDLETDGQYYNLIDPEKRLK